MARVALEQITRRFNQVTAIDDITFEVPDGQFWVLVGPSGCGKSTLLRMIAGLESVTSGHLYIGDRRVNEVPARQRDVAMVFQNYALYPHMTVAANLGFGLQMRGVDRATIQQQIESVARSLNIAHLLDRKPAQLSGGQQQRVALGRAIARQPQVFLLDEPLSNLDAQLRDDTRAELKQLHQAVGITTIYVTHDQVEAMTLADQIVVLNAGKIQQIGDPQTIYAHPANQMVATFMGTPPMTILPGQIAGETVWIHGHPLTWTASTPLSLVLHQRLVHIGIRPEHVQVVPAETSNALSVKVTVIEPLGREILVRAVVSSEQATAPVGLTLQLPPEAHPQVGDRLWVRLNFDRAVLFDPETGDRLLP